MSTFSKASVSVGGDVPVLVNIDALRNHLPRRLHDGSIVIVTGQSEPGDAKGGIFIWSDTDNQADDGMNVIIPAGGFVSGRWLRAI